MFDVKTLIANDLTEAQDLREKLEIHADALEQAAHLCADAFKQGGKIVLFGNGGSAADAQHIAAEFVGRFEVEREPLPAIALTTNTSALTAIGNDYDYSIVFERQVQALVKEQDIVIGFSTSGNSENILKGIRAAAKIGAKTIGFSGKGGALKDSVDISLAVPSSHTPRIQEAHILLAHILTHAIETLYLQS
jgi:D-sedoheptulose 7-phosphate isomerase